MAILALGGFFTLLARESRKLLSEYDNASWSKTGRTQHRFGQSGTNISLLTKSLIAPPYKIYTTDFDVEISAQKLCEEFYGNGEIFLRRQKQLTELIANSDRLTPLPNSIKSSDDLLVTLLLDQSGSLTGAALQHLVLAVDRTARQISDSKFAFEILGFTTRSWRGGASRKLWALNGKPSKPGRLCDLMHIVYKNLAESYEATFPNMTVMLEDDIRRENIDGEALLWAHSRYEKSGKKKWICVVLSDGAPVDDSTLASNTSTFLQEHLLSVTSELQAKPEVQILGLGIGVSIGQCYSNSIQVEDANELKHLLVPEIMKLISA